MAGEATTYTQDELDAKVAEVVEGLKKSQTALLREAKEAKAKLAGYDGVDAEEFKRLKDAAEKAEREKAEGAGNWKALEAQLTKKLEDVSAAKDREATRLRASLAEHLIDAEATRELARHSDTPNLLLPHVQRHMKVVEQDGRFAARIVDANGNVRISSKGQGSDPMTLAELMDEMKASTDYAPAFRGTGSTGGGAARTNAGGAGSSRTIAHGDKAAFGANIKDIASGKVEVV